MNKKKLLFCFLILACISALCAAANTESQSIGDVTMLGSTNYSNSPSITGQQDIISRDMDILERLYRYIDTNYLYDIDYSKAYEAMASALFDSLDEKYSYYVPKDESQDFEDDTLGVYGGLGFYFSKTYVKYQDPQDEQTLYCIIERTFPGSPSAQGGILSMDLITAIDGESTIGLEATECSKKMKGEPGTKVVLTIKRGDQVFDLSLTRQIVTVPTIESCMLEGNIGYIIINEFSSTTAYNFYNRLNELTSQGIKGLVIDLRNNGGGDLDTALTIADLMLDDPVLITIEYKDPSENETYVGNKGSILSEDVPIAILGNGGTASSSELLILCLRDNGRAKLIGTKTFGKGILQHVTPFNEGYCSLTVAAFYGKNHEEFHKLGLEPDIAVDDSLSDEQMTIISKMLEEDAFNAFKEANPVMSDEAIDRFAVQAHEQYGLGEPQLKALLYSLYQSALPSEQRTIANPKYDVVLQAALDHLKE